MPKTETTELLSFDCVDSALLEEKISEDQERMISEVYTANANTEPPPYPEYRRREDPVSHV